MAVITVCRQIGSGAEELARQLAANLGCELVGSRELQQLAESCDQDYRDACTAFEHEAFGGLLERMFFNRPAYKSLFEALNFELAARGNVIILGRGAQVVLQQVPGVFHLRVVAPRRLRVTRVAQARKLEVADAESLVDNEDSEHRALLQSVFKVDLEDAHLYDLVCNSAHFSAVDLAAVVEEAVRRKRDGKEAAYSPERLPELAFAKKMESAIRKHVRSLPLAEGIKVELAAARTVRLLGLVQGQRDLEEAEKIACRFAPEWQVENQLRAVSGI